MKIMTVTEKIKSVLEPKRSGVPARLFVTREDGITIYDSVQDNTTTAVAALVSGVWQASEALVDLVHKKNDSMSFRLSFDTSSNGVFLFPFSLSGTRFFLGAIYNDCLNPGQLKRNISLIKDEIEMLYDTGVPVKKNIVSGREGYLFKDISDEEIDRIFSLGGV